MDIGMGLVLYLIIWIVTFMVAVPIRIKTQGESGVIVPGTQSGSPEQHHLKKKALIVTAVAALVWGIVATIIITGAITLEDIDMLFKRMGRP
ncbi:hypothetical protein MNBD_ALPHA07-2113 [hydrothermal vent metagenome]|uniref:Uncharacterized protein n=1 Tax=hydrothermal vent metagenome TaxID=652676 RepID=A0A3B0SUM6_9ZZZZ